ncbi:hypothetical protein OF83DRAFT_628438 [Amylostereum chailletii]|nr:hypothetical protein OF83DRAFT_628438 [Amylostereum chailletii]
MLRKRVLPRGEASWPSAFHWPCTPRKERNALQKSSHALRSPSSSLCAAVSCPQLRCFADTARAGTLQHVGKYYTIISISTLIFREHFALPNASCWASRRRWGPAQDLAAESCPGLSRAHTNVCLSSPARRILLTLPFRHARPKKSLERPMPLFPRLPFGRSHLPGKRVRDLPGGSDGGPLSTSPFFLLPPSSSFTGAPKVTLSARAVLGGAAINSDAMAPLRPLSSFFERSPL